MMRRKKYWSKRAAFALCPELRSVVQDLATIEARVLHLIKEKTALEAQQAIDAAGRERITREHQQYFNDQQEIMKYLRETRAEDFLHNRFTGLTFPQMIVKLIGEKVTTHG